MFPLDQVTEVLAFLCDHYKINQQPCQRLLHRSFGVHFEIFLNNIVEQLCHQLSILFINKYIFITSNTLCN